MGTSISKATTRRISPSLRRARRASLLTSPSLRRRRLRSKIDIKSDDINERIQELYQKINTILARIRRREVRFSKLVGEWKRKEVVDTFVPLVHLDNDKKVSCRQKEFFKEIWVKKRVKDAKKAA